MEATNISFWLRLALVITTSFIVISYIFKPSDNQCQMTFMMEPPRFIPIPIDDPLYNLNSPKSSIDNEQIIKRHGYKLFMYSEFGFPLENDVRRDLKDSMPVLFVPGNAGSYQQVRSLASTCIRRQLQALDAFKFIFYTIDFQAQLSGLSGNLVENQIDFLNLALNQIVKIHPTETNGVIVVGHSIGGFVAKALLARSSFDTNIVPLLINLASPLTRPFVNFDYKMQQLYNSTNAHWMKKQNESKTLTISISGGKLDRLVPVHLSLDLQYDISLTTSSIDEVWLPADHVSITWCRELMNKLARLLSSLMDKKHTRLIEGKANQLARVKTELLTPSKDGVLVEDIPVTTEQKLITSNKVVIVENFFTTTRCQLLESSTILNLTTISQEDLLVWLEHIDAFKETAIFGCQDVHINANNARCEGKMNLIEHFKTIPTRRHELKKRILLIRQEDVKLGYLILDFSSPLRDDPRKNKIPESISIQTIKRHKLQTLQVPTLSSYLLSSVLRPSELVRNLHTPVKQLKTFARFELVNLKYSSQYYNMIVQSTLCASGDASETSALLIQDEYVKESFYSKDDSATVIIKLDPHKTILMDSSKEQSKLYLDLYLDGTCSHTLRIKFDLWSFIENLIQMFPGEILACSCYLAYCSILVNTSLYMNVQDGTSAWNKLNWLLGLVGFILVFLTSRLSNKHSSDTNHQILSFCSITILSSGLVALVDHVVNRLVDLATIVNNFQALIRNKIVDYRADNANGANKTASSKDPKSEANEAKPYQLDYEWPVVFLTALGGLFLSEALMCLCVLFMMLKLKLKLSIARPHPQTVPSSAEANGSRLKRTPDLSSTVNNQQHDYAYNMVLSATTLCIISAICSVPTALLMINSTEISMYIDTNYVASLGSMIIAKFISLKVESRMLKGPKISQNTMLQRVLSCTPKYLYLLGLLPMMLVSRNIRVMSHVVLITLVWVASTLSGCKHDNSKKKTD